MIAAAKNNKVAVQVGSQGRSQPEAYLAHRYLANGAIGFAWVLLIAVSVSTVKQHFLVDGVAGAGLACAAYAVIIRPYGRVPVEESAYGWSGPLLYLVFHGLVYSTAYAAFRAGF